MKKALAVFLLLLFLLSACTMKKPEPNKEDFIEFFTKTNFVFWVIEAVNSPEVFNTDENKAFMARGMIPAVRGYYDDAAGAEARMDDQGFRLYTAEELLPISLDLLGYDYFANKSERFTDSGPYLAEIMITDAGDAAKPDADSYIFKDGYVSIEVAVVSHKDTSDGPTYETWFRYYFAYMPDNEYIPYRFIKSELAQT